MSNYPETYAKVISPSNENSQEAMKARIEVLEFLNRVGNTNRKKEDWTQGWKCRREMVRGTQEEEVEQEKTNGSYSPTRPTIYEGLALQQLTLGLGDSTAIFKLDLGVSIRFYQISLNDLVLRDHKMLDALIRRMTALVNTKYAGSHTFSASIDGKLKSIVTPVVARKLSISEEYIADIKTSDELFPGKQTKAITNPLSPLKTPSTSDIILEDDSDNEEPEILNEKATSQKKSKKTENEGEKNGEKRKKKNNHQEQKAKKIKQGKGDKEQDEEIRLKEEELRKQEKQKQDEEMRLQEEEQKRREEQKQEEIRLKEEEQKKQVKRKQDEEVRLKEAELKRKEKQKQEEEIRRKEEEQRKQEKQKQDEEMRLKEEEQKRREEQKQEEIRLKEEEQKRKEKQKQEEEIRRKEEEQRKQEKQKQDEEERLKEEKRIQEEKHNEESKRKELEASEDRGTDCTTLNGNITASERARTLLRKGGMPLFPAGRREWNQEEVIPLITIPAVVSWPPKNWKKMTPEQKYFNWEYASIALELNSGKQLQFTKEELLLKYHFLALPGTKTPTGSEENTMATKSRFYLYQALAYIIKSDKEDTSTVQTLKMLETAVKERDNSTDDVIKRIDALDIPLRLGEDIEH
ncbi:neurofilament medium polypeptide-like [Mytilus californianus]|uniref:neurofilament medium polypeptide-like n=1 Tax=Mytilus californianus TaxID=6549 RepID=UPI00224552D2|nr:neurofilament medium polypeptide-like [Mytilus californianus]